MWCLLPIFKRGKRTINGVSYANLPKQLRKAINTKRLGITTKEDLNQQHNALVHKSLGFMATSRYCDFELVDCAPCFHARTPSDYYLFPKMELGGPGTVVTMTSCLLMLTFLTKRTIASAPI